jgi:non-heme chloroperoxidase
MTIQIRDAALPDGVRLPYAEHGDPSGLPVLMLHGWSDSWRSFEGVLPHLPASIRALALTLPGHGDATGPDRHTVADMSEDVVAFLDVLGIESVLIAGHSMGTIVAQRVAIDHPDRVAGLVLLGARPTFAAPDMEELYAAVAALTDPVDVAFIREFQESTVVRPVAPGLIDMSVAESRKLTARTWHGTLAGVLRHDLSGDLPLIGAPTLIVAGEHDDIAPPARAEELRALIPGARLVVHAGAGHAMHWEDPERVAAEVALLAADTAAVA